MHLSFLLTRQRNRRLAHSPLLAVAGLAHRPGPLQRAPHLLGGPLARREGGRDGEGPGKPPGHPDEEQPVGLVPVPPPATSTACLCCQEAAQRSIPWHCWSSRPSFPSPLPSCSLRAGFSLRAPRVTWLSPPSSVGLRWEPLPTSCSEELWGWCAGWLLLGAGGEFQEGSEEELEQGCS